MSRLRLRNSPLLAIVVLFCPLIPGCGDGKPWVDSSLNEGTVTGIVSVKGKPADGGTILFNASNHARIVPIKTATIGKDGSYTIKTYTGVNQVSFDGEIAAKNRGVGLAKDFLDVKAGENKHDFDVLGEGGGKKPLFDIENPAKGKAKAGPPMRR